MAPGDYFVDMSYVVGEYTKSGLNLANVQLRWPTLWGDVYESAPKGGINGEVVAHASYPWKKGQFTMYVGCVEIFRYYPTIAIPKNSSNEKVNVDFDITINRVIGPVECAQKNKFPARAAP